MKKENEEKKHKKRKLKWQVKLFLLILFIIIYAFFIGPKGIFIKDYNIKTSKISNLSSGIKILQISDIYYGSTINKSDIKNIVKKINENNAEEVYENTEISVEYLSETDKIKISEGIRVNGIEELNQLLEDFE